MPGQVFTVGSRPVKDVSAPAPDAGRLSRLTSRPIIPDHRNARAARQRGVSGASEHPPQRCPAERDDLREFADVGVEYKDAGRMAREPLGRAPTTTFSTLATPSTERMPIVFSPRFDVNTRSCSSETSAPGTPRRSRSRPDVAPRRAVDDVDGVVGGVGDVHAPCAPVDSRVVRATRLRVRRQFDVADVRE